MNNSYEDIVKIYMKDIGQEKLLTPEEEKNLAIRAKANDIEARNQLIVSNLKLVTSIAKKYIGNGISFLDLVQEGNIGLIAAIDKFDPNLGYKFSTYAYPLIKSSISRAVNQQSRSIRIPVYIVEKISKFKKIKQELCQAEKGQEPSNEDIAKKMGISVKEVCEIQEYMMDTISLDSPAGEDSDDDSIGNFVKDTKENSNPESFYEEASMKESLNIVLNTLPDREAGILKMRFGIGYSHPLTLEEVGKQYNITRERVRQIEALALKKMRNPVRAQMLQDYL